eukprot:SM000230S07356  [mRNA]  locus=s230:211151:215601:- [translate_table: standard]
MAAHRDPLDASHPERPERIRSIFAALQARGLAQRHGSRSCDDHPALRSEPPLATPTAAGGLALQWLSQLLLVALLPRSASAGAPRFSPSGSSRHQEVMHPQAPTRTLVLTLEESPAAAAQARRCVRVPAREASDDELLLVHTPAHVSQMREVSSPSLGRRARAALAGRYNSIYFNEGSSNAALLAAGSVVELAEQVARGQLRAGAAVVRPPGHHAEEDVAMGFCLYNNVAIAAKHLVEKKELGIAKVLVVDWDVHHGNGIQHMFYDDPRILYFSVHRHDGGMFYPGGGDGDFDMVGEGKGVGFNINVPWPSGGFGDLDYLAVWDNVLMPAARQFDPHVVLISGGFDAAEGDPLGGCCLTPYGYSHMTEKLLALADGKVVLALEGGYNLKSISASYAACTASLLGDGPEQVPLQSRKELRPQTFDVLIKVRKELSQYWPALSPALSLLDVNVALGNLSIESLELKDSPIQATAGQDRGTMVLSSRSKPSPLADSTSLVSSDTKLQSHGVLEVETAEQSDLAAASYVLKETPTVSLQSSRPRPSSASHPDGVADINQQSKHENTAAGHNGAAFAGTSFPAPTGHHTEDQHQASSHFTDEEAAVMHAEATSSERLLDAANAGRATEGGDSESQGLQGAAEAAPAAGSESSALLSTNRVWYASYGSNMWEERFLCYIRGGQVAGMAQPCVGCKDKRPPAASCWIQVPHRMFFGHRKTATWGLGGVAFLDPRPSATTMSWVRIYNIAWDQFNDIILQENIRSVAPGSNAQIFSPSNVPLLQGPDVAPSYNTLQLLSGWYGTLKYLGERDGAPILTFTCSLADLESPHPQALPTDYPPSASYKQAICNGLVDGLGLSAEEAAAYIDACAQPLS